MTIDSFALKKSSSRIADASTHAYSPKTAGIKDVRNLEIPMINVDNQIDYLLHALTNVGVVSHKEFRSSFWGAVEQARESLKQLENQWKADVEAMYAAAKKGDLQNILHYRVLAYTSEKNYETTLIKIAVDVLANLGKIVDEKKWLVRLREEIEKRKKMAERVQRDLASI